MLVLVCAFWRAGIAVWAIGCAAGARSAMVVRFGAKYWTSRAGPGAWIGRSNRVGASDWLLAEYGR
jgi:hypothetical protein